MILLFTGNGKIFLTEQCVVKQTLHNILPKLCKKAVCGELNGFIYFTEFCIAEQVGG